MSAKRRVRKIMDDPNKKVEATPPVSSGVNSELQKLIADSISAAFKPIADAIGVMTKQQGIIADTLTKLPPAQLEQKPDENSGNKKADEQPKTLTLDEVQKLLDTTLAKQQQQNANSAERSKFIAEKLAKIPAVYQNQLGTDPSKWNDELKTIQSSFESDFKAAGGKVENIGAPGTTTTTPPETKLDASKLTQKQFAETFLPKVPGTAEKKS
jgi:hypothetical protein